MFSMHLDFYKISFGHFQTRSKSLSRALLQFEHTNAQHTGIWWLPWPANLLPSSSICDNPHWLCYSSHSLEWSCDRLEISVHTNCQGSHLYFSHFLSHSLEWAFDISDELEHLKPSFELILKTRTLVHNTSLLSLRHQIKLFSCPKSKRVYRDFLSVDSYNYEPAKTEWSQSWWNVFFVAYISAWCPPVCHYHKR